MSSQDLRLYFVKSCGNVLISRSLSSTVHHHQTYDYLSSDKSELQCVMNE